VIAARQLLRHGPLVAFITRGAEGALVVTQHAQLTLPSPPADIVDSIGAGDAFSGGFLAWWRHHALTRRHLHDLKAVAAATGFACPQPPAPASDPVATPPHLAELKHAAPIEPST
jgi:fructokinase